MSLSPEVLVAIVGLGGAVIGALPGLITSLVNKRAEDKRHFNQLIFNAAIESWKLTAEHSRSIMPLEHYIIHAAKMCEFALSGKPLTPETIAKQLQEIEAVMKVLSEHAKSVSSGTKKA
jgi:hypothetical protein